MASQLTAAETAQLVLQANQRGEEVVSVLATAGDPAGARVLVHRDGTLTATLGASALDAAARSLATTVFELREPSLRDDLFAELHAPAERLFIFGAGHIAMPLAELAVKLAFAVTVLDDREEFASSQRFPAQARVLGLDLAAPLRGLDIERSSYVVLVTRAHKHDFDLLRAILALDAQPRYIGMIGSRRRIRAAFTALIEGGVAREQLATLHAPVGLDIGAETPAEIAVSIAAELIRVRRGGNAESLAHEERVLERFFPETSS
ncbi:MAG: XdhC family protein [Gemmatimonadota bacterium]